MQFDTAMLVALRNVGLLSTVAEPLPTKTKLPKAAVVTKYRYRNLPCSITSDDRLWYVEGVDAYGGSGVLEWCYDEEDAQAMLAEMNKHPQFSQLAACPFVPGVGMNRLVKTMLQ